MPQVLRSKTESPPAHGTTPRVAVVVPVYDHGATLKAVIEGALSVIRPVIVVDDGSREPVSNILQGLDVTIIRHESNRGKGAAILSGAEEARRVGMTHIVTIDADGQHDPSDIRRFLPIVQEMPDSILVGQRIFGSSVPRSSRFGRSFSNFWFRLQTGHSVGDSQSGFRVYPLSVLARMKLKERRYSFEVEVLVKAAWGGLPVKDVPVSVYYPPAWQRISHFDAFRDNVRISLLNSRLTMRALLPVPHRRLLRHEDRVSITPLHPIRSLRFLVRKNVLPRPLAAAAILGVFLGTLPLIACHTVAILGAASFMRLNKVTAIAASQICMPPLVPAFCIEIGYYMRHGRFLTEVSLQTLGHQAIERIYEWILGSLILAPVLALAVGCIIYCMALAIKWGIDSGDE